MLFENFLNIISCYYYPKDKSIFDIDYNDSVEYKRFIQKVNFNNSKNNEINYFLEKLEEKIKPKTIREFRMGSNFPSYNFQIILHSNESEINVLSIYISHLIPFFHICQLRGHETNFKKKISINRIYSDDTIELINLIKNEITREIFYYDFPSNLLLKKVPKIRIEENFTFLNAFFIDHHRISNF